MVLCEAAHCNGLFGEKIGVDCCAYVFWKCEEEAIMEFPTFRQLVLTDGLLHLCEVENSPPLESFLLLC